MNKRLAYILGILLLIEILCNQFIPKLTFISGELTITNRIIGYFSFSGFVISLLLLLKVNKWLTIPLGIILSIFFVVNTLAEIRPIDTTSEPTDMTVLNTDSIGRKTIVRKYINAKTNRTI